MIKRIRRRVYGWRSLSPPASIFRTHSLGLRSLNRRRTGNFPSLINLHPALVAVLLISICRSASSPSFLLDMYTVPETFLLRRGCLFNQGRSAMHKISTAAFALALSVGSTNLAKADSPARIGCLPNR